MPLPAFLTRSKETTVQKPHVVEIVALTLTAVVAGSVTANLVDHHVGIGVIVTVVAAILASGLFFTTRLGEESRAQVFTCRTEGCGLRISAWNQPADELAWMRELAADHSRHASRT